MISIVYYNPPLYQLSYLEWMTRVAGHMRGVGIEPTRIAPLDLKTNSLTTRTSPLQKRGCNLDLSWKDLGHPRYRNLPPITALRAKTVPHCDSPPPSCFYSRSNEPSRFLFVFFWFCFCPNRVPPPLFRRTFRRTFRR